GRRTGLLVNTVANFELTFLVLRRGLADARRRALLRGLRRRHAPHLLGGRHGRDLHGRRPGRPRAGAPLRASDADGLPPGLAGLTRVSVVKLSRRRGLVRMTRGHREEALRPLAAASATLRRPDEPATEARLPEGHR